MAGIPIPSEQPTRKHHLSWSVTDRIALAESWDSERDLTGWWLSEKLDGVRAYWDGRKLYSKHGKLIQTPDWFVQSLPRVPLDGELWSGRGTFESVVACVHAPTVDSGKWSGIKYHLFDLPGSVETLEKRLDQLQRLELPAHATLVERVRCEGTRHLNSLLDLTLSEGGEGLIALEPGSLYAPGKRTHSVLKVKRVDDSEVLMISASESGSLSCLQTNGDPCKVRCHKEVLLDPPKPGTVLSVKHSGLWDNGKLRNPFFWRERPELSWDHCRKER